MTKDKGILIKNIYYMLSYAFSALRESAYEDIQKENFENIHNLFAAILSRGIGLQLKRGLYREYIDRTEDLSVVRGKINIPGMLRRRAVQKLYVTCEHDELSENNLFNQILKSTVSLLLRESDVEEKYKKELKREMLYLASVDTISLVNVKWNHIRFQRNNRSYRMLLAVCQLLAEGVLLTTEAGDFRLASYIDEQPMNRLYEKFILEYYAREYARHIAGFSAEPARIYWQLDDGYAELLPVMKTDITLTYGNKVLIIDAKYYKRTLQKNFDVHSIHSANLYQIFTYVKNKDTELGNIPHEVAGMLLYAKTEEELYPDNSYRMSGNRISVKTLDLNREFAEIRRQLDNIACGYFGLDPGQQR